LRIGRPADYKPPPPHLVNFVVGFPPGVTPPPNTGAAANVSLTTLGGMAVGGLPTMGMGMGMGMPGALGGMGGLGVTLPSMAGLAGLTGTAIPGIPGFAGLPMPAGINPAALAAATSNSTLTSSLVNPSSSGSSGSNESAGTPTKVLLLLNMVQESELSNDEEFADIIADVRDECSKHGQVIRVVIPRPFKAGGDQVDDGKADFGPCTGIGTGRIFVHYQVFQ
jgi:hypothetical protein